MLRIAPSKEMQEAADSKQVSDYWFDDGDCVVQVGTTLFKVHRFLFRRDDSAFVDIFKLPQPEPAAEDGKSDSQSGIEGSISANPIVLSDKVDEFRALCWSMYSLALDLRVEETKAVNIQRLIDLAFIANKYNFKKTEKWAMDLLDKHCQAPDKTDSKDGLTSICLTCSSSTFEELVELCQRCGRKKLREFIEKKWLKRLSDGKLPVSHAFEVGERLCMNSFLAQAYYAYIVKAGNLPSSRLGQATLALVAPFALEKSEDLPLIHRFRLNAGLISLMFVGKAIEEGLQQDINTFPSSPDPPCPAHGNRKGCVPTAEKALKVLPEFGRTACMTDVLGLLGHLIKKCEPKKGEKVCAVVEGLKDRRSNIQKSLGDHFRVGEPL